MKKQNNLGFTLFELLVVVSIIGVLLGMATLAFSVAQKRSRDSRRIGDMKALQKAVEQYYALSDGDYPNPVYSSGSLTHSSTTIMQVFSVDPKNSGDYIYTFSGDATTYCYCALLEDNTAGNSNAACADWSETTHYCVTNLQ